MMAASHPQVQRVAFNNQGAPQADFSAEGLLALSLIAGLTAAPEAMLDSHAPARLVGLVHRPINSQAPPSCTRLSNGSGVWVVRFDRARRRLSFYCPSRDPDYYGTSGATHEWAKAVVAR
jgi:hypothetical protein